MPEEQEKHYRNLEAMYRQGPINSFFNPEISVNKGQAIIQSAVSPDFQHAAGGLHGCIYFKMLDDAAYFAAASREDQYFLVTISFQVYFMRSISNGVLKAEGKLLKFAPGLIVAESTLVDERGREISRGSGTFSKSGILLEKAAGYGTFHGDA